MKFLIVLVFVMISFLSIADGIPVLQYKIVSDTVISNVPKGKCLVHGVVTLEKESFEGVKVSTEKHKFSTVAGAKGEYQFLIDVQKIRIYAFQPGYEEVVTKEYDFKSGHSVHIDFFMRENREIYLELKPVIYAYNPKELKASIEMTLVGNLTFSYPKYNNKWDVLVKETGVSLQNKPEKVYPYLFWEGDKKGLTFQSSQTSFNGYQINTDSTIQFLETQCKSFGFNAIETTDFITFWGPRITQYSYAKIEFLVDKQYGVIGKLEITPNSDNIRRVYILFEGRKTFDSSLNCSEFQVDPISRKGFTIIEWGGSELIPSKRINP